jgi:hypothetical protein
MKSSYDIKPINEFAYSLKIHGHHIIPLYKTIIKVLQNAHYDNETESIFFLAENIMTFNPHQKKSIQDCVALIDDLTQQINYLKTMNYGIYGFDDNSIMIIDGIFILCNSQYVFPIEEEHFAFIEPIYKPTFSSPEIIRINSLPSTINYKCCYYSLGALVVYCLLGKNLLVSNKIKSKNEIELILNPIFNTKIYWFIERCLQETPENRVALLL